MNKILIIITYILFSVGYTQAQPLSLNIDAGAEELVEALQGAGVTILNAELDCHSTRSATYQDHNDILDIDDGVVLSAGNLVGLLYDNTEFPVPPFSSFPSGSRHIDSIFHRWLLDSWGLTFFDGVGGCALILDVVPEYTTLSFDYVLGDGLLDSIVPGVEEDWGDQFNWISYSYLMAECKCYPFTDFISALIMGGSLEDTINLAVFPEGQHGSTSVPVNRYTLRMDEEMFDYMCMWEGGAEGLYWDGGPYLDYCRYNQAGGSIEEPSLRLRGMTIPMTASIELEPCDTYKLVLGTGVPLMIPLCTGTIGSPISASRAAYFISNLRSIGADCTAGVEEVDALPGLGIGPNPFKTELLLSYPAAQGDENFRILLSDITGRTLLQAQGTIENLNQDIAKIIPSLTPGTYIAQLTHTKNAKSKVFKVVKE